MAIKLIGCGTAKCGSTSLWRLLQGCYHGTFECKHEREMLGRELPWQYDRDKIASRVRHFQNKEGNYGEVAFYFLKYIPKMLSEIPELKVICLKRDMKQTIASFHKTIIGNPFSNKSGCGKCYPYYREDLDSCLHEYYRTYYEMAESFECLLPDRFRIFDTETLNSLKGQDKIYDFVGIDKPNRNYLMPCRYNITGVNNI